MRIASTQYHITMNTALQTASARLEETLQKMASGARYSLPSDNPIATVRLSRLSREEAQLGQYRDNIAALRSRLSKNESLLDGMSADVLSARDLLVWASDGSNTSADVNAMADSMQPLLDSLLYTANTRDAENRYIFAGTTNASPAITYDPLAAIGSRYTYTGNGGMQQVLVGSGVTQTANVTLPEMANLLNQLEAAMGTLRTPGVNVNNPVEHAQLVTTLDAIDAGLGALSSKIATLGGAQNILTTLDDNHANLSLSNQHTAITLGQLDYAAAAVNLNGYTTAVQAAQKAYGEVSKLSLFNVL